jgi:hypothetical protein
LVLPVLVLSAGVTGAGASARIALFGALVLQCWCIALMVLVLKVNNC